MSTQPIQLTDAQWQSYVLHAVADHLAMHPSLPAVHISPWRRPSGRARISMASTTDELTSLIMWSGSLHVDDLIVERRIRYGRDPDIPLRAELHAHARLSGLLAWGHRYIVDVDAFAEVDALTPSPLAHGDTVPLADLMVAAVQPGDLAEQLAALGPGGRS